MRVYLDYNATAPIRPEVAAKMAEVLPMGANPSSVHAEGRRARGQLSGARSQVAALVGARPENVVFTSGGTEANNWALAAARSLGAKHLLVSAIEHPSVLEAAPHVGVPVTHLPVDAAGRIDLDAAARLIEETSPALVSAMQVNNETGVVQPVAELSRMVHEAGGWLHCDAVQAAGRIDIDCAALGADMLSLSAHKLGGPQGVGALILRDGLTPAPLLRGGGQERRYRAGTENVAGIAGFGVAAELARESRDKDGIAALRDQMESAIKQAAPDAIVFGEEAERVANTSCFGAPGLSAETLVMALDLEGIAVSAGSACSSGKVARSHVLSAMNVGDALADGAIRVSLGWATEASHIEKLVDVWTGLWQHKHAKRADNGTADTGRLMAAQR